MSHIRFRCTLFAPLSKLATEQSISDNNMTAKIRVSRKPSGSFIGDISLFERESDKK